MVRTKHLPGETLPTQYSSITEIRSGEVPEDINYFLVESEQRQGALAAGVFVQDSGEGNQVTAAGGWYVQLLPFADEESITKLEANLAALDLETLRALEEVLDVENPDLFKWLTQQEPAPTAMRENRAFVALEAYVAGFLRRHAASPTRAKGGAEWVRGWSDPGDSLVQPDPVLTVSSGNQ